LFCGCKDSEFFDRTICSNEKTINCVPKKEKERGKQRSGNVQNTVSPAWAALTVMDTGYGRHYGYQKTVPVHYYENTLFIHFLTGNCAIAVSAMIYELLII
jgi:hypothetical protein